MSKRSAKSMFLKRLLMNHNEENRAKKLKCSVNVYNINNEEECNFDEEQAPVEAPDEVQGEVPVEAPVEVPIEVAYPVEDVLVIINNNDKTTEICDNTSPNILKGNKNQNIFLYICALCVNCVF